MIIGTTTDQQSEEDTEVASRVTRSVFDNFMKRPSLSDQAISTIASMANNDLSMMRGEDDSVACDAAFVFLDKEGVRFLISGRAAAWHFEEGKMKHRSQPEMAPTIGGGLSYKARLEPAFELKEGKNAFLVASRSVDELLTDSELEELLNASSTPEEWMDLIIEKIGPDRQFCAITAFLPEEKPSFIQGLFSHA